MSASYGLVLCCGQVPNSRRRTLVDLTGDDLDGSQDSGGIVIHHRPPTPDTADSRPTHRRRIDSPEVLSGKKVLTEQDLQVRFKLYRPGEVYLWSEAITKAWSTGIHSWNALMLAAPTVEEAAQILLALCRFNAAGRNPVEWDDVLRDIGTRLLLRPLNDPNLRDQTLGYACAYVPLAGIINQNMAIHVRNSAGQGPILDVLRAALLIQLQKVPLFSQQGAFFSVRWSPLDGPDPRERYEEYVVTGILCALIMVRTETAPLPFSPALLFLLLVGLDSPVLRVDPLFIEHLDPGLAPVAQAWTSWLVNPSRSEKELGVDRLRSSLLECDMDSAAFPKDPTLQELIDLDKSFYCGLMLKRLSVRDRSELMALRDGLAWILEARQVKPKCTNCGASLEIQCSNVKGLIGKLYSRAVKNVEEVMQVVRCVSARYGDFSEDQIARNEKYEDRFLTHLRRYLCGEGHPNTEKIIDLLGEDVVKSDKSKLLRCRLLLEMMTGSPMLPLGDHINLNVRIYCHCVPVQG
ncbi:hypothetical protein SISNIDRAFT_234059 [Sistotremastrum niveocremeum HHB9708]|uniref:Uncharacterized protein n=1 Tax=Sistotremastrum niveocremeum HHB9708 TaxID=1314777 RepID=A0A164PUX1_9AGAM|nr:hypothetical protein SISNIDRAFT_234059 [Sistotremastrum niveocremeum HHB9708]